MADFQACIEATVCVDRGVTDAQLTAAAILYLADVIEECVNGVENTADKGLVSVLANKLDNITVAVEAGIG